jgi:hypothetical protein
MAGWREIKESAETSATTMQKWGGLASFLLTVTLIVPPWIYLVGDLRAAIGPFAYALADFLFGPACAASLVMALVALRERIGERAAPNVSGVTGCGACGSNVRDRRLFPVCQPPVPFDSSRAVR